jgi:hypothetical protein
MNTTLVESELVLIKAKLDLVQTYINSGDYFMAQQTLNEVKALLEQAYSDYKNITSNTLSNTLSNIFNIFHGNLLYIVIGGVAIAAVIIGYLFWPTKERPKTVFFKPKIGEKSPEGGAWQKLKEKWSWLKLRKKWGAST